MKRGIGLITIGFLLLVGTGIFISSCQKEDPPVMEATSIQLVSGGNQTSDSESTLTSPVEVLVKDQEGNAFQGSKVSFAVIEGSLSVGTATTDASGKARTKWTLGTTAGTQTLTVTAYTGNGTTVLSGSPISVKATANEIIEATSIELVSGKDQSGDVESILTEPIKLVVKDQDGNPFPGATVNFEVSEGVVSSASEITDASGNASTTWTLGSTAGTQSLTITTYKADGTTALAGSPLSVNATANAILEATSIELVSGGSQTGNIGTALPNPLVFIVKDQDGNSFQGVTVNFTVGEGSVSSASETSDANGNVSVTWTLGSTEGTQTLTVSAFKSDGTTDLTGSPLQVNTTAIAMNGSTTVVDFDGNIYQTVQIGNQTWMAENLKVTHFPDGAEIPLVTNKTSWANLGDNDTQKAYCFYDNDENSEYGVLYTSAAAMNGAGSSRTNPSGIQGVCPDNWHLPSDMEWWELRSYLGTATAAGKMKTVNYWASPNTGATNESGFSALPGGDRRPDNGVFRNLSYGGVWHTTYHKSATNILVINILYLNEDIKAYNLPKSGAYSVRCVKDQ